MVSSPDLETIPAFFRKDWAFLLLAVIFFTTSTLSSSRVFIFFVAGFVEGMIKPSSKDGANANLAISRSDIQLFVEQHLDKIEESVKEQLAASKEGDLNYRHYAALLRNVQKIKEGYYGKDADTRSSDK